MRSAERHSTKQVSLSILGSVAGTAMILVSGMSMAQSPSPGRSLIPPVSSRAKNVASSELVRVPATYVCMPNNRRFSKKQIAVQIDGRTYYGCCRVCVKMLKLDPEVRSAVDPVSGVKVDKAVAVIGAAPDNSVYYFENEANMRHFKRQASPAR